MEISAIKQFMKDHKITYEELAKKTGLSKSCITKIFAGYARYPRIDTMQAIERALGLAPTWTDDDRAQGVGNAPIVLSDRDLNTLTIINRAEEVLGVPYVDAVLNMLEINVKNAKKI
jgi:transcriptional regulator with XRE-family HTH domain